MSTTDIISSTISGLFCRMQSKGYKRLDAKHKVQTLQDSCGLYAKKFFFCKVTSKLRSFCPPVSSCTLCQVVILCRCRCSVATFADLPDDSTTCFELIP
ncbi:hypothetical protein TNCV_3469231 [Trichonephila clavipes]|nr:hypothetical protein TNCV_3469231 [Trichonephila clavipes]